MHNISISGHILDPQPPDRAYIILEHSLILWSVLFDQVFRKLRYLTELREATIDREHSKNEQPYFGGLFKVGKQLGVDISTGLNVLKHLNQHACTANTRLSQTCYTDPTRLSIKDTNLARVFAYFWLFLAIFGRLS